MLCLPFLWNYALNQVVIRGCGVFNEFNRREGIV
jgi:hypothetical protein